MRTGVISSFVSNDGVRQVHLYAGGVTEFYIENKLVKTVCLSHLTRQELEDRAEDFVMSM